MRLYIRRKKPIFPSIHVYVILVLFCENQFGQYVVLGSIEWIKYFRNPPIDSWLCMHGSSLPWWREGRGSGPSLENSNLAKITENMLRNSPHTHHHLGKMFWIRACLTMRKHILHFLLNFTINHLFFTIQFSFFQLWKT